MPKLFVKICGITDLEDAQLAVNCGADAIGFIFHPASPRHVQYESIRSWSKDISDSVLKVGVFVEQSIAEIEDIMSICNLDWAQFHGAVPHKPTQMFDSRYIQAYRVRGNQTDQPIHHYHPTPNAILLDAFNEESYGGTGHSFNWDAIQHIQTTSSVPVIIAGGLNNDNLDQLVQTVKVYGIDLSSGLEEKAGKKSVEKCNLFKEWLAHYRAI